MSGTGKGTHLTCHLHDKQRHLHDQADETEIWQNEFIVNFAEFVAFICAEKYTSKSRTGRRRKVREVSGEESR